MKKLLILSICQCFFLGGMVQAQIPCLPGNHILIPDANLPKDLFVLRFQNPPPVWPAVWVCHTPCSTDTKRIIRKASVVTDTTGWEFAPLADGVACPAGCPRRVLATPVSTFTVVLTWENVFECKAQCPGDNCTWTFREEETQITPWTERAPAMPLCIGNAPIPGLPPPPPGPRIQMPRPSWG